MRFKPYSEINLGERDSQEYLHSEKRELFEKLFLRDEKMNKILENNKYFVVGDKGTGKSAYPVYLENHNGQELDRTTKRFARVVNMKDTDYHRFIKLKESKNLDNSDYCDVWKVILLMLVASDLMKNEDQTVFNKKRFSTIKKAIEDFYLMAYTPEIAASMQFVEDYKNTVNIFLKAHSSELGGSHSSSEQTSTDSVRIQIAIPFLIRQFIESFNELKPQNEHLVFIDGIDIRPADIPYEEYLQCIKGLVEAVYSLNSETFQRNKRLRNCRVLVCIRTDIFFSLDLHNMNAKLHDNTVIMDWQWSYRDYRASSLFKLADRLFKNQQNTPSDYQDGECWDHYFPYKLENPYKDDSFIDFLKSSFFRPRDILEYLRVIQQNNTNEKNVFLNRDFKSRDVEKSYSNYLLGEIKDAMNIYGNAQEFDGLVKFFTFLMEEKDIKYGEIPRNKFTKAFDNYKKHLADQNIAIPQIFANGIDSFLQLLFKLNIICYTDRTLSGTKLSHWYFKERSSTNIQPQIKTNDNAMYQMHRGIATALKLVR